MYCAASLIAYARSRIIHAAEVMRYSMHSGVSHWCHLATKYTETTRTAQYIFRRQTLVPSSDKILETTRAAQYTFRRQTLVSSSDKIYGNGACGTVGIPSGARR